MDDGSVTASNKYGSYYAWPVRSVALGVPSASTGTADSVTSDAAVLNGTVNPNRSSTTCYFEYGPTNEYGTNTEVVNIGSGSSEVPVTASIDGLSPDTVYHVRVVAQNDLGTGMGEDYTFTTLSEPSAPTVTTGNATEVTADAAVLNGEVNPNRAETTYYFEYGRADTYGEATPVMDTEALSGTVPVSTPLSGLDANTTYYRVS